jgi:hypothetical protein
MRKLFLILMLVLLPGVFALGIFDAFSIIDPFVSGTLVITVTGDSNAPSWNQSISNVTVNQDASVSTVDSSMVLFGNGQCTDADGTTPTFSVASENTSAVDCSVSGVQLNITPASSFYGNSTCIISCADATNSTNSTFTITVNEVSAGGAGGGAGGAGGGGAGGAGGAAAECSEDSDCSSGYSCNTGTGQCYDSCSSNSQCSSGYFCSSSNTCDEIECNYDSDCSEGYACDTSDYACYDSCSSNDECASGYYCDEDASCESGSGGGAAFFLAPTFKIEPEIINIKLTEGQTAVKTFTISNFKSIPRNFRLSLRGIASLAVIPTNVFIEAKSKEVISIDFKVPEDIRIGVYSGSIDVEAKLISVIVEVRSEYSDLEIGLTLQGNKSSFAPFAGQFDMRAVYPGQDLSPKVDLSSFYERGFSLLDVEYSLLDSENQVVYSEIVETQFNSEPFTKYITLPTNIAPGRYVLSVLIDQGEVSGLASKTFDVRSRFSLLDDFVIQLSIIILIISAIFLLYVHYRAKKHKPKSR